MARFAAWAAAYALVFNVILTSALLAAVSPLKLNAVHELCLSGDSTGPDSDGNSGKPVAHCPLCVSNAAAANLPPQPPALAIRIALHALFEPASHDVVVRHAALNDHQPRGPPHLS